METISVNTSAFYWERLRKIFGTLIWMSCLFLFAISAYDKITDHERFLKGLAKVKYVGNFAPAVSYLVPIGEIAVCLLLSISKTVRLGLYGFIGLMGIFTLHIAVMLLWAEKLPCHCNLIIEKLSFGQHLIFNIAFILLAFLELWLKTNNSKILKFKLR
ncbi:MauE/DoxX family redox-associated membrane protein [Pedobacter psychrodurus]|uniref:MauE/DoxX family redox-associated membrane protein n=1 Tax=Pedobacter psychrodurus TaxID=2530456 RepID=UPI00292E577D|nr:MauE/DoxX family redox-associated membrane protein [Pedobacter psychrodurus]